MFGEGKKDSILAVFGMFLGIFIYAMTISSIKRIFLSYEITGNIKVLFKLNHWVIILPEATIFISVIYLLNNPYSDSRNVF